MRCISMVPPCLLCISFKFSVLHTDKCEASKALVAIAGVEPARLAGRIIPTCTVATVFSPGDYVRFRLSTSSVYQFRQMAVVPTAAPDARTRRRDFLHTFIMSSVDHKLFWEWWQVANPAILVRWSKPSSLRRLYRANGVPPIQAWHI